MAVPGKANTLSEQLHLFAMHGKPILQSAQQQDAELRQADEAAEQVMKEVADLERCLNEARAAPTHEGMDQIVEKLVGVVEPR